MVPILPVASSNVIVGVAAVVGFPDITMVGRFLYPKPAVANVIEPNANPKTASPAAFCPVVS